VGVDEERKQIACGLVDTIGTISHSFRLFFSSDVSRSGSYTFAKTLEYKAKHGLNAGKEVTVMPPAEYHDRFVSALDGYFLACPGTLLLFFVRVLKDVEC
jgi:1-phosphatidylinositol-3-phosphate 5-kinase